MKLWFGPFLSCLLLALATPMRADAPAPVVLFLGDSLTAGYGLEAGEAYPTRVQELAAADGVTLTVVNAGLSGDTTAGGVRRLPWLLRQPLDVLVLALGANDGLRGLPLDHTRANLQAIVDQVRARQPKVRIILAGMQVPPNLGPEYTAGFRRLFPELAEKNRLLLVPFLLEGVGGVPELNLADGLHPNAAGQKVLAANVWKVLQPVVREPPR